MFAPDTAKQNVTPMPAAPSIAAPHLSQTGDCVARLPQVLPREPFSPERAKMKLKPQKPATPDAVLHAFNTWAFKREQPTTADTLLASISKAVTASRPVEFVLYWGKGPRSTASEYEIACLDFLAAMAARIRATYPVGAVFRLIFTDTHATLNGHTTGSMNAYFAEVAGLAEARGFTTCRLGDLIAAHDPENRFHVAGDLSQDPMFADLTRCAAKWYAGEGCAEEGAEHYYRMNLREKRVVEVAFPDSIFVTFNGSTFRGLFPDTLPIFYMYSLKRGCAVKPWFLPQREADPAMAPATEA